jgi:hypothetical protein
MPTPTLPATTERYQLKVGEQLTPVFVNDGRIIKVHPEFYWMQNKAIADILEDERVVSAYREGQLVKGEPIPPPEPAPKEVRTKEEEDEVIRQKKRAARKRRAPGAQAETAAK